jgi:hypothetical protein
MEIGACFVFAAAAVFPAAAFLSLKRGGCALSERVRVVVVDDQYLARGFFEGLVRMSGRYELAASLGESIDILIERGDYNIQNETSGKEIYSSVTNDDKFTGLPDAKVIAKVTDIAGGKKLTVTANVGNAEYVYEKDYRV